MQRPKPRLVAFKAEDSLADLLDRLPNKSEFIRRAILTQLGGTCPLCMGAGVVPTGIVQHFAPIIETNRTCHCCTCGKPCAIRGTLSSIPVDEQPSWEQFLHGGPFFCPDCFERTTTCEECGWHIEPTHMAEHICSHKV